MWGDGDRAVGDGLRNDDGAEGRVQRKEGISARGCGGKEKVVLQPLSEVLGGRSVITHVVRGAISGARARSGVK